MDEIVIGCKKNESVGILGYYKGAFLDEHGNDLFKILFYPEKDKPAEDYFEYCVYYNAKNSFNTSPFEMVWGWKDGENITFKGSYVGQSLYGHEIIHLGVRLYVDHIAFYA